MSSTAPKSLTTDEFLAWIETQPKQRYELVDGEVFAMAPEKADHARSKGAAWVALKSAIQTAGVPCEAFLDGLAVRIDDNSVYEPDALVNCGPRVPGGSTLATNPVIVVEVLSPSTTVYDHGVKFIGYFSVPSIQHYLIVHTAKKIVIHHQRGEGAKISTTIHSSGKLDLSPPGIVVPVSDLIEIG